MSKRDPEIALRQILEHAREAVEICLGKERSDLDSDGCSTSLSLD
jgi:hypothetical protein